MPAGEGTLNFAVDYTPGNEYETDGYDFTDANYLESTEEENK